MKKISILILAVAALIALYLKLRSVQFDFVIAENQPNLAAAVVKKELQPASKKDISTSQALPAATSEAVMGTDETIPRVIPDPPIVTTKHTANDFNWGQFTDTMLNKTIHLSESASANGSPISGTYTSSAQLKHRAFDSITLDYTAEVPSGSSLKFEIQTKASEEHWSDWQEIDLHHLRKPIQLVESASGWRYRFTFSAPSVESSPRLQNVTITTHNSVLLAKGPAAIVSGEPTVNP